MKVAVANHDTRVDISFISWNKYMFELCET